MNRTLGLALGSTAKSGWAEADRTSRKIRAECFMIEIR
jgi:hypothetical protein